MRIVSAIVVASLAFYSLQAFAQAEPNDAHPRLFADQRIIVAWREAARKSDSAVRYAIDRCAAFAARPSEFSRDGYMGLDWAQYLQACLVAWKATDELRYARTAHRYFLALIDDLQEVGDGKGGDKAASRDSGFAIRALGPYTALAYDWLAPSGLLDEGVKARARQRFRAWTEWYASNGYRARSPGTNYNAGYFFAATLIAVAQGSEAGIDGARLWNVVVNDLFRKDLLPAAANGVLAGGDWGEGWQYAPLSVAEYALAARAVERYGVNVAPVSRWLEDIAVRHVYALTPGGDETFVGGDTQAQSPNVAVRLETLAAVVAGPASPVVKGWAQAEIERLRSAFSAPGFVLFAALAEAEKIKPAAFPRATKPTDYFSRGTSVLFARSSWHPSAVWFVAPCSSTIDVDHVHPNAGNFVLTRGDDNLIVDPSPYGTLSSLTSNAPTVESTILPANYLPSQAFWSKRTRFTWGARLTSGELFARCDYADQYRFQDRPSDIPLALRDFILLPFGDPGNEESAVLIVVDRARAQRSSQNLHLRFRATAELREQADRSVSGIMGASKLSLRTLQISGGAPELRSEPRGSCFIEARNYTRGNCDAARFAVNELKLRIPGPMASAVHMLEVGGKKVSHDAPQLLTAQRAAAWQIVRDERRWNVIVAEASGQVRVEAADEAAVNVFLAFESEGAARVRVQAERNGAGCRFTIGGDMGLEMSAAPLIFGVDRGCVVRPVAGRSVLTDSSASR